MQLDNFVSDFCHTIIFDHPAHEGVEAMVATMNLAALTDKQLKIYLGNCKRLGARTARINSTALSRNGLRLPGEHRVRDEDVLDR